MRNWFPQQLLRWSGNFLQNESKCDFGLSFYGLCVCVRAQNVHTQTHTQIHMTKNKVLTFHSGPE